MRRTWAINFYQDFDAHIDQQYASLKSLKTTIKSISKRRKGKLQFEEQNTGRGTKFQIFLHEGDLKGVSAYKLDDQLVGKFDNYFKEKGGLHNWINLSEEQINNQLWDFMNTTDIIQGKLNHTIDDVLRKMHKENPELLHEYLNRLKVLASPLWSYNLQGYNAGAANLDQFVVVGVNNRDTDFLAQDSSINEFYDLPGNKASFASTQQNDRIYVMMVEDLLPIYAVNNFATYQEDNSNKIQEDRLSNAIDEKLLSRMYSENFDMMPKVEKDNLLDMWVHGFIFGLIHFDEEQGMYWLESVERGDPIEDFRYNLNSQRDVAFDKFKTDNFAKEIQAVLDGKIAREGADAYTQKLIEANNTGYLKHYAQLSSTELLNLKEEKFARVRTLISNEIKLLAQYK